MGYDGVKPKTVAQTSSVASHLFLRVIRKRLPVWTPSGVSPLPHGRGSVLQA